MTIIDCTNYSVVVPISSGSVQKHVFRYFVRPHLSHIYLLHLLYRLSIFIKKKKKTKNKIKGTVFRLRKTSTADLCAGSRQWYTEGVHIVFTVRRGGGWQTCVAQLLRSCPTKTDRRAADPWTDSIIAAVEFWSKVCC